MGEATPAQRRHLDEMKARLDALVADWAIVTEAQRRELADQIADAVEDTRGPLTDTQLTALSVETGTALTLLLDALREQGSAGAREAATELAAAQGAPAEDLEEELAALAAGTVALLGAALALSAARTALRVIAPDMTAAVAASRVTDELERLTDAGLRADLGGALWAANNIGRFVTFQLVADETDTSWVADETLDASTCPPCKTMAGTVFTTLSAARLAYPVMGHWACHGGVRCRGTVRPLVLSDVDDADNIADQENPMPNIRKLTALASQLRARSGTGPGAPEGHDPGAWYRISNHAPGERSEILIYAPISDWWGITAQDFIRDLRALGAVDLDVRINCEGGQVFDGIAIYNALLSHPGDVAVYVDGLAASAASFIAMAGSTVTIARTARMMIHDASGFAMGNASDMRSMAELLNDLSDNIASIYAERAGGTTQEWRDRMLAETWYTAEAAVESGLADTIGAGRTPEPTDPAPEDATPVTPDAGFDGQAMLNALKGAFS